MNKPTVIRRCLKASALSGLALVSCYSHAAWVVAPSVQVETRYDDNLRLDENDQSGYETTTSVQAALSRITETSRISLVGRLSYQMYMDVDDVDGLDDLDDEDLQLVNLIAQKRIERFRFGARSSVRRDILLRRTEFIPEDFRQSGSSGGGDQDGMISLDDPLDPTEIEDDDIDTNTSREQVRRTSVRIEPYVTYELTENTDVEIGAQYLGLNYGSNADEAGVDDSVSTAIYGDLRLRASEQDVLSFRARVSNSDPDEGLERDNYEAILGWDRRVTERLSLGISGGASRVESDESEDNGWLFGADATYTSESSRLSAGIRRSIRPSAYGDVVEADTANLTYVQNIGERWSFTLAANGFDTSSSSDGPSQRDRKFANISPSINWAMTRATTLSLGYSYDWIERDDEPDSYTANSISFSFTYSPPSEI